MTRDELVKILNDHQSEAFNPTAEGAADRILAAIEKEREGEQILDEGYWDEVRHNTLLPVSSLVGVRGHLIFRPAKGEGEQYGISR